MLPGFPGRANASGITAGTDLRAAIATLQAYQIIDKKPESELRLNDQISRAEFAKMLGAALKQQDLANSQQNVAAFPDTAGHWANGWIAVMKFRGIFQGRDGRFFPDDKITHAEILTVLLRMTGRGAEAGQNWPWGALTTSLMLGMIPSDLPIGDRLSEHASRSTAFRLTAIALGRIHLASRSETFLQNVHDRMAPTLSLTEIPPTTDKASVVVQGLSRDAVAVTVNNVETSLEADGRFSKEVTLASGINRIKVVAMDGAGNRSEREVMVDYQKVQVRLEIRPNLIETGVGQTFAIPAVLRMERNGEPVPADAITWSYDTAALTLDPNNNGQFQANTPGEYTLRATVDGLHTTATVVVAGPPAKLDLQIDESTLVTGGLPTAVRIRVLDANGRLNKAGNQQIQLELAPQGLATLDMQSVSTAGGEATVYVAPGNMTGGVGLQAKMIGIQEIVSPLMPINVEHRKVTGVKLETVPANVGLKAGQPVKVIATAVDQMGLPIMVRDNLSVKLSSVNAGVAYMKHATATIPAGASSSEQGGQSGLAMTTGSKGDATITGVVPGMKVEVARIKANTPGGLARLDVRVLQQAAMSDDLSAAIIEVARLDANGQVASNSTTPVVLLTDSQTVSVSPISDVAGVTTYAIRSNTPGRFTLTAGIPGQPQMNSAPVTVAFVQAVSNARPVIKMAAMQATAGESAVAYVALESNGTDVIPNPGPPLFIRLEATGGTINKHEVVIPSGATRSEDVMLNLPMDIYSASISGYIVGGKPIQQAQVSVVPPPPPVQEPIPTGLNLTIKPVASGRSPMAGEEHRFIVQVRDGVQVQNGQYAFRMKARLNGQELTALPPELEIRIGKYLVQNVTARTIAGEAELWVRYTGTGVLELEPVPTTYVDTAYDHWGAAGPALSTMAYVPVKGTVTYTPAALSHMAVKLDPGMGDGMHGAMKAARGRSTTVRLTPVDAFGNSTGNSCVASLTQVGASEGNHHAIRSGWADVTEQAVSIGSLGYAEFTVVSLSDVEAWSEWAPTVVCGSKALTTRENIRIATTLAAAPVPQAEFFGGDVSGHGIVDLRDSHLKIRLMQNYTGPEVAEVLLFDSTRLIGRFGPVFLRERDEAKRTIIIPKALLGTSNRSISLQLRLNSGASVSDPSLYYLITYRATQ